MAVWGIRGVMVGSSVEVECSAVVSVRKRGAASKESGSVKRKRQRSLLFRGAEGRRADERSKKRAGRRRRKVNEQLREKDAFPGGQPGSGTAAKKAAEGEQAKVRFNE
ncbi:hypothetical protein GCM10008949_24750 [Deinococcus humi]|nr:hypothetical protein GCM10008949_24750 [Deinococcus humi]